MRHVHIMPTDLSQGYSAPARSRPRRASGWRYPRDIHITLFRRAPHGHPHLQPRAGSAAGPSQYLARPAGLATGVAPSLFGTQQRLFFAGPPAQRYLRVYADKTFYILARQLELDPQALPWLSITWGVERFPAGAALDLNGRNDRPIVVMVSFGERVGPSGLLPSVPRALAFFWGETEQVGTMYTCITPRNGPPDIRLQCRYPHVKYIALRHGEAGSIHTDQVNLLEHFQAHFSDYWQEHHRVPQVVAVSIEASSRKTQSISSARLYSLSFSAAVETSDGPVVRTR